MAFGVSEIVLLVALVITIIFAYAIFRPQSPTNSDTPAKDNKKDEKKKAESSKPRMVVFFGSQSGTAETFAQDLADEAKTYGFAAESADLEGYEKDDLANEKFAVFLMATFGEGEPTDNSAEFYEWINQEEREEDLLKSVCFAVFALGNRQYEHFCAIGRKLDKRMAKLGAERLLEHGEGDDDGSLETDYAEWKTKFWQATKKKFGIGPTDEEGKVPEFKPSFDITWVPYDKANEDAAKAKGTQTPHTKYVSGMDGFKPDPKHKVEQATVVENRELRPDISDGNSTRHIELDIKDCLFSYITADNLGVYPRNDYKLAGKVATRLGVNPKDLFSLKNKDSGSSRKSHYPKIISVQDALHWYCDFGALAKLKTVATFAQYAEDEKEKRQLLKCVTEDKEKFLEDKKAIWEVLEEFPSVKIPFHAFLELVPRVQPRYYTISSSSKASPARIAITVAVTIDKLSNGREHRGLCSSYLQSQREDKDKIAVFIRSSTFRLPSQISTPIIMVGPGTGVAPFRGFLHDAWTISKRKEEVKLGDWHLYFGCKNSKKDYIYKEEMEKAKSDGILKRLELAFSRDTEEKVYVQHRLSTQSTELWEIIHTKRAHFYVCGGTAMGRDVRNAIIKIATDQGKLSADAAAKYVKDLQTKGRYIQELWS